MSGAAAWTIVPMSPQCAAAAAALHATAGLPEAWDAAAFATLLAMPGVRGCLALDAGTGEPLGLALWRTVVDEAELLTICVSPQRRRQGLGSTLLEIVLDDSRTQGARRTLLEVATDNAPARSLYGSLGFEACGRRPRYYHTAAGPIDAEIMLKDLTTA